jgi:cbb3-type cytochrome c oxidase subunit III
MRTTLPTPTILLCALLGACPAPVEEPSPSPTPTPIHGDQSYEIFCAVCHGDQGQGYASPQANALANPDFLSAATDEFLRAGIERGRPGTPMAAYSHEYQGPLSVAAIDAIFDFVRAWQTEPSLNLGDEPVLGDAVQGETLYALHCASCHGAEGEGAEAMSLANPVFLETASDPFIRYSIYQGRRGTEMAAWGATLTADEIDALVAFIRSWQDGR